MSISFCAEAVLEPWSSGLSLPNAGITSVRHHARLKVEIFITYILEINRPDRKIIIYNKFLSEKTDKLDVFSIFGIIIS